MLHCKWQEVGGYKCNVVHPWINVAASNLHQPAFTCWTWLSSSTWAQSFLRGSDVFGLTDVIYVVLTWQWSLKILWSQPNCPLHICPYAKVEPAILSSTKLTSFSLQCFCSQSSTSLRATIYRSLKVFTSDVFPSMHVRVGCFFTLSPSFPISILAMSAALVSVSHQSWLTNNEPCATLPLSHHSPAFSYVNRSRQLRRELQFLPVTDPLTTWGNPGVTVLNSEVRYRGSVNGLQHISINTKYLWFIFSQTWTQAQHRKTGENIQKGLVSGTRHCAVKMILAVIRASSRKIHPRLNAESFLGG